MPLRRRRTEQLLRFGLVADEGDPEHLDLACCVQGSEERELVHQYADAEVYPDVGVSGWCCSVLELGGEKVAYGREFEEEEVGDGRGPVDAACLGETSRNSGVRSVRLGTCDAMTRSARW